MRSRSEVVKTVNSFLGLKESDGSFKKIINIYNGFKGELPRNTKMKYNWSWCACTWSAVAIKLGYTDVMPIEISCGELIKAAKKMDCWVENDGYIPMPGDGILYDWDDNGKGNNTGWPDHVGTIVFVNKASGYMTVVEGNYGNAVKKRTISINGKYIRGFIVPKYDDNKIPSKPKKNGPKKDIKVVAREVIAGEWGDLPERRISLEKAGYNYEEVQIKVREILNNVSKTTGKHLENKEITTSCHAKLYDENLAGEYTATENVYCRNDAGGNKKALCLIPKGTKVMNYGYYNLYGGIKWLLIQFTIDKIKYTGFSTSEYLKK